MLRESARGAIVLLVAAALAYAAVLGLSELFVAIAGTLSFVLRVPPTSQADIEAAFIVLQHIMVDGSTYVVLGSLVLALTWLVIFVYWRQPAVPLDLRRRRSHWLPTFLLCLFGLCVLAYFLLLRTDQLIYGAYVYFLALLTGSLSAFIVLWLGMLIAVPTSWRFAVPGAHFRSLLSGKRNLAGGHANG